MKKSNFNLLFFLLLFSFPKFTFSQCTAVAGATNATSCLCPAGAGTNCDLLPDISIAHFPLTQTYNYTEYPQSCNPPCDGNDGRLRIGVSTPIIGYGPLETRGTAFYVCGLDTINAGTVANIPVTCPVTGLPPHQLINQRIYHKNGNVMSFTDRAAGSMTYHPTHGHQHVDNWGIYTLRLNNGDPNPLNWPILGSGTKLGFCLLDISDCNANNGYCTDSLGNTLNSTNIVNFGLGGGMYNCSNTVQGISNGFMDTYSQALDGMWINVPPGLCNGTYYVVIQIDPLNYFLETNENNNVYAAPLTLTQQGGSVPVISASGSTTICAGGSVTLTSSTAANYIWSNGATTQSIVVTSAGTYTVTVNTTLNCSSNSAPVTVTVIFPTVSVSASPAIVCAGTNSQLTVMHNLPLTTTVPTVFTNNTPVFIPDNTVSGVTSPDTVTGISPAILSSGTIVSVKLNLTHTYDDDLIISLISPSGNQINLSNRRGGGSDNFTNTEFSMSAVTPISNGTAPFTGSFIPDSSFSVLTGNANGVWFLKVADVAGNDTGRIQNWSLTINNVLSTPPAFSWTSSNGFSSTSQNPVATPTITTVYSVAITAANGCTGAGTTSVTVNPLPVVSFSGLAATYSVTDPPATLVPTPAGGTFSGNGISGSTFSPASAGIGGPFTITYTYTDSNGCTNSVSQQVIVNAGGYNCAVPQSVNVISVGPLSALVTWANSTAPQFKVILQPLLPSGANLTYVINGNPNVLSYPLTGLKPNTVYKVWVRTVCNGTAGQSSNTKTFTTSGYIYNCTIPTGLSVTNILSSSARISWSNTATADSFQVRYRVATGSPVYLYKKISGTKYTTLLTNLLPNKTYKWWVQSRCGGFDYGYSEYSTFTTLAARINTLEGLENGFTAIPNPASTHVDIYFSSKTSGPYTFDVMDVIGHRIYTEERFANSGENSFMLDVQNFAKGIYILKLQQGKGFAYLRLVVQ